MYINTLPVFIARLLDAHPVTVFSYFVVLLTVVSALMIRRTVDASGLDFNRVVLSLIVLSWIGFTSGFFHLIGQFYGQREHVFALLYFPYFFARWVRWEGGRLKSLDALLVGVFAAIATSIKPHFVPMALAPEVYWLIAKRNVRPVLAKEFIAFIFVGVAVAVYLLLLFIFDVGMFREWLSTVPLMYRSYWGSMDWVLFRGRYYLAVFFVVSVLITVFRGHFFRSTGRIVWPVFVFTTTATIMYFFQHTGFRYQLIPALHGLTIVIITTVCVVVCAALREKIPQITAIMRDWRWLLMVDSHWPRRIYWGLVGLFVLISVYVMGARWHLQWDFSRVTAKSSLAAVIADHTEVRDPVVYIGTLHNVFHPEVVWLDRYIASPYISFFPLMYIAKSIAVDSEDPKRYNDYSNELERHMDFEGRMAHAIMTHKPKMILIDSTARYNGFSSLEFLTQTGFVDSVMVGYRRLPALVESKSHIVPGEAGLKKPGHKVAVYLRIEE